MQKKQLPKQETMEALFAEHKGKIMEVILRLLWNAGISPKEMQKLTWREIDFDAREILLPDRRIPMDEELYQVLWERCDRYQKNRDWSEYVIITDGRRTHMHYISIYRAVRAALDKGGLSEVSPSDLVEAFIIRQLQTHDWPHAVRVSGISIRTLYSKYSQYLPNRLKNAKAEVDEARLWGLLQEEGPTAAGLTLWMTWQLGLNLQEIASLTWAQVDLYTGSLLLEDRVVAIDETLEGWLREMDSARAEDSDPHVLLTPRARTSFDPVRLGVVARQLLIRGGMEEITAKSLLRNHTTHRQREYEDRLLQHVEAVGCIDRQETMELLDITKATAYGLLRRLTEQGELVLIGARYYRKGSVVPPEEHWNVIRDYLTRESGAYRKELAAQLQVEVRSCSWILRGLVEEGKLVKQGQRYYLAESEKCAL